jgi:hypothetical protein
MAGVSFNNMRHVFPKKQVTNPATLLWGGTSINEVTQQNRPTLYALGNLFQSLEWAVRSKLRGHPTPRQPVAGRAEALIG